MPEVSVAMATYNGGRHLRAQLDSINRQTRRPKEVILCDDGSTDDTLEVARRFAAEVPYPVVIDAHGQRLNYNGNFTRAVNRCTGEIVALCDQDDVWDERKLETAGRVFQDERVAAVVHRIRVVDEELAPTPLLMPPAEVLGRHTLFDLSPRYSPNGMQMLFRRSKIAPLVNDAPPLSQWSTWPASFDEQIFYLATLTGSVVMMKEVLGVWRRHGTSTTGDLDHTETIHSAAHHRKLGFAAGGVVFTHLRRVAESRAHFAARAASSASGAALVVQGASEYYQRIADAYRHRAVLHDPNSGVLTRGAEFGRMLTRRAYRRRSRGGLGAKSFLKDCAAVLRGRAWPQR